MGGFKERYLKYEASGYRYIFKCASSLYIENFMLTTFFGFSSLETL